MLRTGPNMGCCFFRNKNLSEVLYLSRLSASLIKIWLKLKRQISGLRQTWCFWHSKASNSNVNSPIWPQFKLVPYFKAVLVPSSLKMIRSKVKTLSSGQHFLHFKSMGKFFVAQRRVTPRWITRSGPKFSRGFMANLITCKFDEDPNKNEVAILRLRLWTKFSPS